MPLPIPLSVCTDTDIDAGWLAENGVAGGFSKLQAQHTVPAAPRDGPGFRQTFPARPRQSAASLRGKRSRVQVWPKLTPYGSSPTRHLPVQTVAPERESSQPCPILRSCPHLARAARRIMLTQGPSASSRTKPFRSRPSALKKLPFTSTFPLGNRARTLKKCVPSSTGSYPKTGE